MAELSTFNRLRSQVFSTSQRVSPPDNLPGLFRPGNAHGVYLFKGFPSLDAEHLSACHAPHVLTRYRAAYRGLSNQQVRIHTTTGESSRGTDPLLSFILSRVVVHLCRLTLSRSLPSCASHASYPKISDPWHFRVSNTVGLAPLFREQSSLLRFLSLSHRLQLSASAPPGLWFYL